MEMAIALFTGFTALDAIGPYEVLSRLPDVQLTFVGHDEGPVRADTGSLAIVADATFEDIPAPQILLVPGGPGQARHMDDERLLAWLRGADATSTWTTSVCTGSLLLAAAGLLEGRRAACHWLGLEQLRQFGAEPVPDRVVMDGKVVTAGGVSSGIDMALTLAARIAGDEVAQAIQLGIEYDPQPPFDAGSPAKAPAALVDFFRDNSRFMLEGQ